MAQLEPLRIQQPPANAVEKKAQRPKKRTTNFIGTWMFGDWDAKSEVWLVDEERKTLFMTSMNTLDTTGLVKYGRAQVELCANSEPQPGRQHWQFAFVTSRPASLKQLTVALPHCHIECARSITACMAYCQKKETATGEMVEWHPDNIPVGQGCRINPKLYKKRKLDVFKTDPDVPTVFARAFGLGQRFQRRLDLPNIHDFVVSVENTSPEEICHRLENEKVPKTDIFWTSWDGMRVKWGFEDYDGQPHLIVDNRLRVDCSDFIPGKLRKLHDVKFGTVLPEWTHVHICVGGPAGAGRQGDEST